MKFKCPEEFKEFLKTCSVMELVMATVDLRKSPEDVDFLRAAQAEMKQRHTEAFKR